MVIRLVFDFMCCMLSMFRPPKTKPRSKRHKARQGNRGTPHAPRTTAPRSDILRPRTTPTCVPHSATQNTPAGKRNTIPTDPTAAASAPRRPPTCKAHLPPKVWSGRLTHARAHQTPTTYITYSSHPLITSHAPQPLEKALPSFCSPPALPGSPCDFLPPPVRGGESLL